MINAGRGFQYDEEGNLMIDVDSPQTEVDAEATPVGTVTEGHREHPQRDPTKMGIGILIMLAIAYWLVK